MRPRSYQGEEFCRRLTKGHLQFQRCEECNRLQYPPAEVCRGCLNAALRWDDFDQLACVVACVEVHRCYAEDFAEGGPWWVASVSVAPGVICYAHAMEYLPHGTEVTLVPVLDSLGDGVLAALTDVKQAKQLQLKLTQK